MKRYEIDIKLLVNVPECTSDEHGHSTCENGITTSTRYSVEYIRKEKLDNGLPTGAILATLQDVFSKYPFAVCVKEVSLPKEVPVPIGRPLGEWLEAKRLEDRPEKEKPVFYRHP